MNRLPLAALLVSPFLLGLNRPLAWAALALVMVLAWLRMAWQRRPLSLWPGSTRLRVLLALALGFTLLLPLLQLAGGPCAAIPSAAPCVADPERTWLALSLWSLLVFWFACLLSPLRPATGDLLKALALTGGVQALYALAVYFMGATPLFMAHVPHNEGVPIGGFPNRNHFAAFLYLCIFAGVALVLRLPADTGQGRAARWRLLLDQRMLWRLLIVLMVLALIATRSRAGNAGLLIGLAAGFAWLWLVERRRSRRAGRTLRLAFVGLVIGSVVLVDSVLIGSFVGLEQVQRRLVETSVQGEVRADINSILLAHPQLFTAIGHGSGSFLAAFEPLKTGIEPLLYVQAHNDYLQVLVERGWLGALLFATTLAMLCWLALRDGRSARGAEVRFAFVAATVALMVQAGVEYVTQVPAIWLAWLALAALAVTASSPARQPREMPPPPVAAAPFPRAAARPNQRNTPRLRARAAGNPVRPARIRKGS